MGQGRRLGVFKDGSNSWIRDFVFGSVIDEMLMMEQADVLDFDDDENTSETTRNFYHCNALGSVMEITDMAEAVAVSYRYDPYGAVTITRNSTPQSSDPLGNPWMYTGRFMDEETELYYYRARLFSSQTGRFLQRDPLGYEVGRNLYEYVASSPANLIDPMGLYSVTPSKPGDDIFKEPGYKITSVKPSFKMHLINLMLNTAIGISGACACGKTEIDVKLEKLGGTHAACWQGKQGCVNGPLLNSYKANPVKPYREKRDAPNCPKVRCFVWEWDTEFTIDIEGTSPNGKKWKSRATFSVKAKFDWWNPAKQPDVVVADLAAARCGGGGQGRGVGRLSERGGDSSLSSGYSLDGATALHIR